MWLETKSKFIPYVENECLLLSAGRQILPSENYQLG